MSAEKAQKHGLSASWAVREVDHLIGRLTRYTRFVLYSKWFLGLFALVLMVSLIAFPLLTKDRSGIRVSFVDQAGKAKQQAAAPAMSNPQYSGTTEDGGQFKIHGIRATQITPSQVNVERVEGQLLKANGTWMSMSAEQALYDQTANTITLTGGVTLITDDGYNFMTERAFIDTKTTDMSGDQPISGTGPAGNILASRFEIRDKGAHIRFLRGDTPVKLHIDRAKK